MWLTRSRPIRGVQRGRTLASSGSDDMTARVFGATSGKKLT